jgi:RNA polymerase sigma-70 factor, ECF subfamily
VSPQNDRAEQDKPSVPSFRAVYNEYAAFVWRSVRRLGVRPADVEDVCQEVFVVVHRKLPEFEGRSTLRTWIFGVCMRTVSAHRRKASVRRELVTDEVPETSTAETQSDSVEQGRIREWMDKILDGLDDDRRAIYVLHELEGVPMSEAAQALGCPLQTAYSRLYAARKHVEAAARKAKFRRFEP